MVVLTSFPPPTEGIKLQESNTTAHIQARDLGKGTLYIAESRLSWVADHGQGFSLEYPAISLHAISKDLNAFPYECLYLMIDAQLDEMAEENEDAEQDDVSPLSEIRFVPENKTVLESMFKAMTECQALHPDPQDSLSDVEEEGCYEDADESDGDIESGTWEGEGTYGEGNGNGCNYTNSIIAQPGEEPMETGQFDDADPEH